MQTHPVAIWGNFSDADAAGRALAKLRELNYETGQIAISKGFRRSWSKFDWSRMLYVRLPEGIVSGAIGGLIAASLASIVVARGIPELLTFSVFVLGGAVAGASLGALGGLAYAGVEQIRESGGPPETSEPVIEIGVQCFDPSAESRAKALLLESGASSVDAHE